MSAEKSLLVTTVTIVTNVTTVTTVTTIIKKYQMILLYHSKGIFFKKVLQQTDRPKDQPIYNQTSRAVCSEYLDIQIYSYKYSFDFRATNIIGHCKFSNIFYYSNIYRGIYSFGKYFLDVEAKNIFGYSFVKHCSRAAQGS